MDRQPCGSAMGGLWSKMEQKSLRLRVRGRGGGAVVWVECRCEGVRVVVGVVYVSPEGVRVEETDQLYVELRRQVVGWREEGKVVMVMGDYNGRIGLGRGEDEVVNRNGRWLLNWCGECDLEIVNAEMKCEGKWTWSRGDKRSTIEYMYVGW